ncbi:MAG: hypothetical protein JO199_02000 [Candidatus Eremiobacteraeota bacterium]|nr:hypothetical protein [Candidatus Eremiobacteraeota bacterium]
MRTLSIVPAFCLVACLSATPGCSAFHQSFQTSFKASFMKSCSARPGATLSGCGCIADDLVAKHSDAELMKLSADDDAARSALAQAEETCAHSPGSSAEPATQGDAGHIQAYVTPYYDSTGPVVHAGRFSDGLASSDDAQFVTTIHRMRAQWSGLSFVPMYVAAIRLYDMGYRDEATYWFYSAQYRGRLYSLLLDVKKAGAMGERGFELQKADESFYALAGPYVNGYAFGHTEMLAGVVRRVQRENRTVPNMHALYPGVPFKPSSEWKAIDRDLNGRMNDLVAWIETHDDSLRRQREENGAAARFGALANRNLP